MSYTIFEIVSHALDTLSPAVTYAWSEYIVETGESLPDVFLVALLVNSPAEQHADDDEKSRSYLIQISTYSRDGLEDLPDVDGVMRTAGFRKAAGRQLPFNDATGHHGLAQDYNFLMEV